MLRSRRLGKRAGCLSRRPRPRKVPHAGWQGIVVALTLAAALGIPPSPAHAGPKDGKEPFDYAACKTAQCVGSHTTYVRDHYDPTACKSDAHDKFYIALGRNVLAVPRTGDAMIGAIYPGMKYDRFAPPDPSDPEGCPGNPLQLQSFAFLYQMDAIKASKSGVPQEKTPRADLLQLIRIRDDQSGVTQNGPLWIGERIQLGDARRACESAALREELPNGMTACRVKLLTKYPELNERIENWAASYLAPPEIYTAPLGEQFVANCDSILFSHPMGHCNVAYVIVPGLGLVYRFQPYLGPHPIHIDQIIDFDRGLRTAIDAALVQNYPWPDESTARKNPRSEGKR